MLLLLDIRLLEAGIKSMTFDFNSRALTNLFLIGAAFITFLNLNYNCIAMYNMLSSNLISNTKYLTLFSFYCR